ncbi:MAG: carboxymuconolactone decarboxylase family protein [Cyclobacteriaceae bacterium]|nr:carboxymuconolactone decarboxylase family protein [Cyclobacteriaceae bacterium]
MNEKIMAEDNLIIKRLFNLDTNTYKEGVLSSAAKELMGFASMVLRCDDCIKYHLEKCFTLRSQLFKVFSVANIVGSFIVIPLLRRTVEYWDVLETK